MKIKKKLVFEVIVLITLIGTVSIIALQNTKDLQSSLIDLRSETLPILDVLKDMRLAGSQINTYTMEVLLIKEEANSAQGQELDELEEEFENKLYEIENAKALFSYAFSKFSSLHTINNDGEPIYEESIASDWNDLVILSNRMINLKSEGESGNKILELKDEFDKAQLSFNQNIDFAIEENVKQIDDKQEYIASVVDNTTITILITINVFIAISLAIRFLLIKSISKPLLKLRRVTSEIAKGEYVQAKIKGNDEIADLGNDIDKMSGELEKLHGEIIKSERLTSIGNLAARLAHDLRNPLSVIKNSMELLTLKLDPLLDQKSSLQMARVGRAVDRMSRQIDDVLEYVNVSDLQLTKNSISTIIESATLGTKIPSSIKLNLPTNSSTVICDPFKIEIVLVNLINNAIQAMPQEGEISVRVKDMESEAVVELEDSGPGIPEEILTKIFDPLFTTKQTGTGLGLSSCRGIIEKHGGTISVSNNPTLFTIRLPKDPKIPIKSLEDEIIHE